jgi:adenosylcobinamide-phosphate synthase
VDLAGLKPSAGALIAAFILDAIAGDPNYSLHPIRLVGRTLSSCERLLRRWQWDAYIGGCILFVFLALSWGLVPAIILNRVQRWNASLGFIIHVILIYMLLALRDLIDHVWAVQGAARLGDLQHARQAIGKMVGRDTAMMDLEGCRRAAIESLAENFVDGLLSPVFWYGLLGVPGLLIFKVVSTMDSMVGYKTPRYVYFGWCGARLDDLMNYLPARIAWLVLGMASIPIPGLSARKGWMVGWKQHAIVPGPNPGWSEATMAGILQRRLIGPIYKEGIQVTTVWIGDSTDPPAGQDRDLTLAVLLIITASSLTIAITAALLLAR